jgi:hypothetical protein
MMGIKGTVAATVAAAAIAGCASAAAVSGPPAAAHVVDVSASEFRFAIDTHGTVPAGLVELKLANIGTMDHEAILARLHQGVSLAQFEQALKSGPAAFALVDFAGGAGAVAAHGRQVTFQALQGGRYVLLCLVSGPDGVPHVMKGMIAELTVTGHLTPAQLAAARPTAHVDGAITAHDMTYTLPAVVSGHGLYRFTDTDHADTHELGIIRLNPGITAADVVAWVKAPGGPPPFTSAGGFGATVPGGGGWVRLDLAPGHYAALCFVPDDAPPHAPHAAMGMVIPFTVR